MQTAGDRIAAATELAACVQHGEDNLDGGPLLDRVLVDRDSAAVVADRDPAVGEQGDGDVGGVAGHSFVDRVIDDLVDQVVQTPLPSGPDVHTGPLADGIQAFEDGDRASVIRHGGSLQR